MNALPFTRDLVLIGGGHAHALVLRRWAMRPLAGARLTLIDPSPTAPYTGMLPGHIAGHYTRADLDIDLVRLARHAGARLVSGKVEGIDPDTQHIHVTGRPKIAFDVASLNIGITSDLPQIPGFNEHAVAAKPLGTYAQRWARYVEAVEAGQIPARIVILGAGVAGVELALAMDHRLRAFPDRQITLIDRSTALPQMGQRARARLLACLEAAQIALIEHKQVAQIEADSVTLDDGQHLPSTLTLGAAGAHPQPWLQDTGLALHDGFIAVDAQLRSTSHPTLFAAGDCAHMTQSPRPKAGVFAVRQAPTLEHNLRASLTGKPLKRFRPQRAYLKLISLGDQSALADKWGLPTQGSVVWRLKDRIDRKFMRMLRELPQMPAPELPREHTLGLAQAVGDKPMCGGCGSKVGPGTLRRALDNLPASPALIQGIGDDAAILRTGSVQQVFATDHLRAFTEDPWMMARIATVHALGDIWAMGAAPQAALASIVLPKMSDELQERSLAEIMAGITSTLNDADCALAGGHTTLGNELTIGLSVTGICEDTPLTKAGAQPGDALILTKPIGSGTLLAGEMSKQAPGPAIAALWPVLTLPQGTASRILARVAHAMTDVTGFGLAGHLDEMLRASGLSAELWLDRIPLLDGAEALAEQGVASTLMPANRAALVGRIAAPTTPRAGLLFDPQTAGGLLAAVPMSDAPETLRTLTDAGYPAARIGQVTALEPNAVALRVLGEDQRSQTSPTICPPMSTQAASPRRV